MALPARRWATSSQVSLPDAYDVRALVLKLVLFCSAACKSHSGRALCSCIPTWGREQSPLAVRCKRAFLLPGVRPFMHGPAFVQGAPL